MNITTRPLSGDEIVQLVSKSKQPWKSIFFISGYTGLRISDLLRLPWTEKPTITEIREKKTGKAKRLFWSDLAEGYWESLYNYGQPRKFLFPPRDPSTYRKALRAHATRLGISTSRLAFHSFRKANAVIAYRQGGAIAAKNAMNHSSLDQTERYIAEALRLEANQAFDSLFHMEGSDE